MANPKQIIAVVGGTGGQGGGVVCALLESGDFTVRVLTRDVESEKARALAKQGCQVVAADLTKPDTLTAACDGAYGVFLVTNFWDPGTGHKEAEQGKAAVRAIKAAGVKHLVWSTLPNSKAISGGKYGVEHFTGKALVDDEVKAAGFEYTTFVEAPMYFQNLTGMMAPQPLPDGGKGWAVPMDPAKKCIHAGDVGELGKLVAAAFARPKELGGGQYASMTAETLSWNDIVSTLNALGHELRVVRVPNEVYDGFYPPVSKEMREMMNYWEDYTYFGPDAETKISLANRVVSGGYTKFSDWARAHMKP